MLLKRTIIFFMAFLLSFSSHAEQITRESVDRIIAEVDAAVNALDAGRLANLLSDDVSITMHISAQGQTQTLKPDKSRYLTMLNDGWNQFSDYRYQRSNVKTQISGNKARVYADVVEKMTINGQTISGESQEEVTIEMINGKALITKVVGYTHM